MIELTQNTPLAPVAKKTLIIAMTARVGSTNLCSALAKLGIFGSPQEFFNPRGTMQEISESLGVDSASDYLAALAREPEIFCFKVAGLDWTPFAHRAREVFPNGRYVFLDRLDLDEQAISLYRAKHARVWHAHKDDDAEALVAPLDPDEIEDCRVQLKSEKKDWLKFFFAAEIKPLYVAYEHMDEDMATVVQMICGEAGHILLRSAVPEGDFRITRDSTTEEWRRRLATLRVS